MLSLFPEACNLIYYLSMARKALWAIGKQMMLINIVKCGSCASGICMLVVWFVILTHRDTWNKTRLTSLKVLMNTFVCWGPGEIK